MTMEQFFRENWGNVLVLALVAAVVCSVLLRMRREKKAGRPGCGCGCESCPSNGVCHPKR